jgi:hypothetical protein
VRVRETEVPGGSCNLWALGMNRGSRRVEGSAAIGVWQDRVVMSQGSKELSQYRNRKRSSYGAASTCIVAGVKYPYSVESATTWARGAHTKYTDVITRM